MPDDRGEDSHAPQPNDARKRGRPVKPVTGFGPFAQFAHRMRAARDADGTPSYLAMGGRVNINQTTLSKADSGAQVPWEHCELYLRSVKVDPAALAAWRDQYDAAVRRAALFHPDLAGVTTRPALRARLRALLAAEGVDERTLLSRRAEAVEHGAPTEVPAAVPEAQRLRTRPLRPTRWTDDEVLWRLYLAGGTPDDVAHWQKRLAALPEEPPLWRDPRVTRPAVIAAAVLVLALIGGAYALGGGGGDTGGQTSVAASTGPSGATRASVPPPQTGGPGGPAAGEFDAIIAAIDPAQAMPGDYAHVDVAIITYGPPPAYPDKKGDVTEELDWSPHAPGRVTVYGSGAAPTPKPLRAGPPLGAAGPPSADPAELQRVLEQRRRSGGGAAALMLGVADLCVTYPLRAPERIAMLRMLRAAPGIAFQDEVIVERLGVNGKAFSADGPWHDPRDPRVRPRQRAAAGERVVDPAPGRHARHDPPDHLSAIGVGRAARLSSVQVADPAGHP